MLMIWEALLLLVYYSSIMKAATYHEKFIHPTVQNKLLGVIAVGPTITMLFLQWQISNRHMLKSFTAEVLISW